MWPVRSMGPLVGPVIGELHVNAKVFSPQQSNDFLKRVPVFATNPNQIALDGGLDFFLRILDGLDDLPGFFRGDALLHSNPLAYRGPGGWFHSAVGQGLKRHSTF